MSKKTHYRLVLGIVVSILCLGLAVRNVPVSDFKTAFVGLHYQWLLVSIILQLLSLTARAKLWQTLLANRVKLADTFWSEGIGYLFTNVLPLRMGEPARVVALSQRSQVPVLQVAAAALVERLLDLITVVLVLVTILPWMRVPHEVKKAGLVIGAGAFLTLFAIVLVSKRGTYGKRLVLYLASKLPVSFSERIVTWYEELVSGINMLSHPRILIPAIGCSFSTWAFTICAYWFVLFSFQSDAALVEAAFMIVALCFAASAPSTPGMVGVFQLVGQQALVLPFGNKYDPAQALAITIVAHALYYVFTSLIGVVGLSRFGIAFVNLRRNLATSD